MVNLSTKPKKKKKFVDVYNRSEKSSECASPQNNSEPSIKYLDIGTVADMLSMSRGAVYQLIYRREIPHYKFGRRIRFREDEIIEILESKRIEAEPQIAEALNKTDPHEAA